VRGGDENKCLVKKKQLTTTHETIASCAKQAHIIGGFGFIL
jgi:hypothetical protein